MKKISKWLLSLVIVGFSTVSALAQKAKDIVILYENDVHCSIDGYTKLAGLRDAIAKADTCYVGIVSCGDFAAGADVGKNSQGKYIVDILRSVGYDAITLGNHELDYGVPHIKELMQQAGAPVVCSNLFDMEGNQIFPSYTIHQYGNKRVAFVGALTPQTMQIERSAFYDADRNQLYDLKRDAIYDLVQQAVDDARAKGADYVIMLSHLGERPASRVDSHDLISKTNGIDALLDAHTHSTVPCVYVENKDGKQIPITQTGIHFANIGKLIITTGGKVSVQLMPVEEITYTSPRVTAITDSIKSLLP